MTIHYRKTTIFNVEAQAIVNTINCVGVMGTGIALECKLRFPTMYENYVSQCRKKHIQVGKVYVYRDDDLNYPLIINFPTKNHWKYPSKLEWIEQGLKHFVEIYQHLHIQSIAFPRLGCDRGKLNWHDVRQVMTQYLSDLDMEVYICLDEELEATGVEGTMISFLNEFPFLLKYLHLSSKDHQEIITSLPLKRFKHLSKLTCYTDVFRFFYKIATERLPGQLSNFSICKALSLVKDNPRNILLYLLYHFVNVRYEYLVRLQWNNIREGSLLLNNSQHTLPLLIWYELREFQHISTHNTIFINQKGTPFSIKAVQSIIGQQAKKYTGYSLKT